MKFNIESECNQPAGEHGAKEAPVHRCVPKVVVCNAAEHERGRWIELLDQEHLRHEQGLVEETHLRIHFLDLII